MSPWLTILSKDMRLTRTRDIVGILSLVIIESLLVYAAYATHDLGPRSFSTAVLIVVLFFLHALYLPIYVGNSLSKEWRKTSPLWLQIPQPGWKLLLSKFISGLLAMVVSLTVTCFFGWWIAGIEAHSLPYPIQDALNLHHLDAQSLLASMRKLSIFAAILLVLQSIYMAAWISLISIVMQSVKNQLAKARWIIGLLIVLIATWGMGAFGSTSVYRTLTEWGRLSIPLDLSLSVPNHAVPSIYTGTLLFHAAIVILLFYLCGLLLDKKVEV